MDIESHYLCEPCRHLLRKGLDGVRGDAVETGDGRRDYHEPHYATFQKLCDAAEAGCHMCLQFLSQRNRDERRDMLRYTTPGVARVRSYQTKGNFSALLWITVSYQITLEANKIPQAGKSSDPAKASMFLEVSEANDFQCELIAGWISECTKSHSTCTKAPKQSLDRPGRLLYVGERSDYLDVRIESNVAIDKPYMTLSHCWGPRGVPIKLLKSNEPQFCDQLPWDLLSKTFQDAINVVRGLSNRLGVYHIWIDALCIIQDSKDDQAREISRMGSIYQNSLCNLAACIGGDSHSGLLLDDLPVRPHDCVFSIKLSDGTSRSIKVANSNSDVTYGALVSTCTLNSRAWVLQEMILGTRAVYFTAGQLIWECRNDCLLETAPTKSQSYEISMPFLYSILYKARRPDQDDDGLTHGKDAQNYQFWFRNVREFSNRKITFNSDRLLAISAAAEQVASALEPTDEYVVGLWKRDLYVQMLWKLEKVSASYSDARMPSKSRPSWSWISIAGHVNLESVHFHYISETKYSDDHCLVHLNPRIEFPPGAYRFGDPISAELDATGIVAKVELHVHRSGSKDDPLHETCTIILPRKGLHRSQELQMRNTSFATLDHLHCDGQQDQKLPKKLKAYCLLVNWTHTHPLPREEKLGHPPTVDDYNKHIDGLLLAPVDSGRGHYRRIGIFNYFSPQNSGIFEVFKSRHGLSRDDFVARGPDGTHQITLV